jgi:4-amino-4-deoxy-L-arabinose transferase-like glycosyltransferase
MAKSATVERISKGFQQHASSTRTEESLSGWPHSSDPPSHPPSSRGRLDSPPARSASVVDRRPLAVAVVLFALALLVCGSRLSVPDICGDDEAADAGVVWEMAENGHWLLPFFNGEMVPEKPPLFYWISAGVAWFRGRVDEVSVRLPSVVMAAITVVMMFLAGRHLVGAPTALLGSLITLSAPMTIARAELGRVDMTLVACTTGAFFAAVFALAPSARRWQRNVFWLLAALAVLVKASAGLGIVVCGTLAVAIADRKRLWQLATPEGIVAFGLLAFGWYAFATWTLGRSFIGANLVGENLKLFVGGRTGTAANRRLRSMLNAPVVSLIGGLMPWSFFAALSIRRWGTAWGRGARLAVAWTAAGLGFFTAADARHTYYVAPLVPPAALFLASVLHAERPAPAPRWSRAALLSLAVTFVTVGAGLLLFRAWAAEDWIGMSASDRLNVLALSTLWPGESRTMVEMLGALVVAAIVFLGVTWRPQPAWILGALIVSLGAQGAMQEALGAAANSRFSLKEFAAAVGRVDGPVYFLGPVIPQIVYHSRRHIHSISVDDSPTERPLYLIASEKQLAEAHDRLTSPVRVLAIGEGRLAQMESARVLLVAIGETLVSSPPTALAGGSRR